MLYMLVSNFLIIPHPFFFYDIIIVGLALRQLRGHPLKDLTNGKNKAYLTAYNYSI
jgi:hypothetical protein